MRSPRSLHQIVDHQMKRWEVEHRAHVPRPGGAPCVAISRQPGADGVAIGRQVAEWLDYGFFDKEIVDEIARDQKVQRSLVAGLDEKVADAIHRFVVDSFHSRTFTESDYMRGLVNVVSTLAQRGMAVLVGRGAAYVMPPERGLRVLVIAPRAVRVERFAREHAIPVAEAAERLKRLDVLRRDFLSVQFGMESDDPDLYDLVVNSEHLDRKAAARVIVEALRQRFRDQG